MGSALGRFLDLHMYITSALKKTDLKAVGLQMALDLLHAKVEMLLLTYSLLYSLIYANSLAFVSFAIIRANVIW